MSNKKTYKIPKFDSIEEEAKFWDTHDVTDYLSELEEVEVVCKPSSLEMTETLTLRLQPSMKRRIERIAKRLGLSASSLTRVWLLEKLNQYGGINNLSVTTLRDDSE